MGKYFVNETAHFYIIKLHTKNIFLLIFKRARVCVTYIKDKFHILFFYF